MEKGLPVIRTAQSKEESTIIKNQTEMEISNGLIYG
jgi:hypothetical protein